MSSIRLFVRKSISSLSFLSSRLLDSSSAPIQVKSRASQLVGGSQYSTYFASKPYDPSKKVEFEVSREQEEWKYVMRLQPPSVIPEPEKKVDLCPSGWWPPKDSAKNLPYYIKRTKNHMVPVYLSMTHRGMRKLTTVKNINGDIWSLEKELNEHLEKVTGLTVGSRVDEVGCKITFRGDYVHNILEWCYLKGF